MIDQPMDLAQDRRQWRRVIEQLELRPSKGRGQNFLVDSSIARSIVDAAAIGDDHGVLEIGPGLGALTSHLLGAAEHVTAIEIDHTLAAYLDKTFGADNRFTLIQADALTYDLGGLFAERPTHVVANLPYSAAAAIVQRVLGTEPAPLSVTVMVQREVAERMLAMPPSMSILSVATQLVAEGELVFHVPSDVFLPAPTVESSVITLHPRQPPLLQLDEVERVMALVNAGFRHKRKNIVNSLELETSLNKGDITERLTAAGIDPGRRAQTLSIDEWIRFSEIWHSQSQP